MGGTSYRFWTCSPIWKIFFSCQLDFWKGLRNWSLRRGLGGKLGQKLRSTLQLEPEVRRLSPKWAMETGSSWEGKRMEKRKRDEKSGKALWITLNQSKGWMARPLLRSCRRFGPKLTSNFSGFGSKNFKLGQFRCEKLATELVIDWRSRWLSCNALSGSSLQPSSSACVVGRTPRRWSLEKWRGTEWPLILEKRR